MKGRGNLLDGIERLTKRLGPGMPQEKARPKVGRKASDATSRRVRIVGWLKHPGKPAGPACSTHGLAVKRLRRRVVVGGPKLKVWVCPRCAEAS